MMAELKFTKSFTQQESIPRVGINLVNRILKSNDPFIEINDLDVSNVDLYNQFRQWWSLGGTTESLTAHISLV